MYVCSIFFNLFFTLLHGGFSIRDTRDIFFLIFFNSHTWSLLHKRFTFFILFIVILFRFCCQTKLKGALFVPVGWCCVRGFCRGLFCSWFLMLWSSFPFCFGGLRSFFVCVWGLISLPPPPPFFFRCSGLHCRLFPGVSTLFFSFFSPCLRRRRAW